MAEEAVLTLLAAIGLGLLIYLVDRNLSTDGPTVDGAEFGQRRAELRNVVAVLLDGPFRGRSLIEPPSYEAEGCEHNATAAFNVGVSSSIAPTFASRVEGIRVMRQVAQAARERGWKVTSGPGESPEDASPGGRRDIVVRIDTDHDVGVSVVAGAASDVLHVAGSSGCYVIDGIHWIGELPRDLGGER